MSLGRRASLKWLGLYAIPAILDSLHVSFKLICGTELKMQITRRISGVASCKYRSKTNTILLFLYSAERAPYLLLYVIKKIEI